MDMRNKRWLRQGLAALAMLPSVLAPSAGSAQEKAHLRLGAGLTTIDAARSWGQHAVVEVSLPARSWLNVRGAGFLSLGAQFSTDRQLTEGLDLNLVVVSHDTPGLPYIGGGLGYTHTRWSGFMPFKHDMGVGGVLGLELGAEGGWFVEARIRYFGNLFMERAATKSIHLLTVGRRW